MMRTGLTALGMVAALLFAVGGTAVAEDDPLAPPPAEKGAPPAPEKGAEKAAEAPKDATPKLPKAPEPAAPTKPAPGSASGWDTPDASPTKAVATDLLPPPVIRNPATGASTAASARGAPSTTTPLPIVSGDNTTPFIPDDTFGVDPALIPGVPRTPSRDTFKAVKPAGARINTVTKVHNVKLGNGTPALRLDVEFGTSGQQGRDLFLAAGFARADTGAPIRSVVPAFAGQAGTVVARTEPVRVRADGRYRASVWVPYGAFPAPAAGSSYNVRALVQLLRRESSGTETVLSHQSTTFTVHGAPLK